MDLIELGSRLELFVDRFLIEATTGDVEQRLHHPQPKNVVLTFDKPWEGTLSGYVAAVLDDDRVRLYYRGWPSKEGREVTCCLESEDGITFTRPSLGLHESDGSKRNNIVWTGLGCHNFTPYRDPNPDAPEDQRYKALGRLKTDDGPGLLAFASPDGYRWSLLREEMVITDGAFDSQNLAFWDAELGLYVCYFRGFRDGVRDIKRCTSADFIGWSETEWLDYGDAPPEHLYTNAVTPYFRAPHIYLGFPCRFVPSRRKIPDHEAKGINDGVLMSSRDGLHWERWLEAFLRPSSDPLCWTDRNHYIAWGMVPTSESEVSLYWNEHNRCLTHRLRRGTIRTDGFVSMRGGWKGGELLTKPFTFGGGKLVVNCDTSAAGAVRFELCDPEGRPCEGRALADSEEFFGSEIAHQVEWAGESDVSQLAGEPVRLRVHLRDANLYSIQFVE